MIYLKVRRLLSTMHISYRYLVLLVLVCIAVFFVHRHKVAHRMLKHAGVYDAGIFQEDYQVDWNAIKLRPKPPASAMHDKWIVITTINPPTSDVKKLAQIPGWKVVIVGDTKSPTNWSYPNCIHLFVDDQLKLGYKVTDLIKFRSYARKNIGFLYAIEHG